MAKKSYDEASVVRALDKKRAIKYHVVGNHVTIIVDKTSPEIGIRTLGKIDYLCNYKHSKEYTAMFVVPEQTSKTLARAFARGYEQEQEERVTRRSGGKLNIASMVKKVTTNKKYK